VSDDCLSLLEAKAIARRLRAQRGAEGSLISHGKALELVARHHGFRDWNTFRAVAGSGPPRNWSPGGRLRGRYLSQPFAATVLDADAVRPGWYRLVLDLDQAVDVVTFAGFSNHRRRIRGVVGPAGETRERTSDGCPLLVVTI
jgi:hypothetical protein